MNKSMDALERFAMELQNRPLGLMIFECMAFAILYLVAVTGHTLTLYIIWKTPRLRTISNYFVACLSVSDLGLAMFVLHLVLATLITSRWPFNEAVCQYQGILIITMSAASIQILAWTAVNRYFRVVNTVQYFQAFTKRNIAIIMIFIWVSSALASSPYLLAGNRFIFHPAKFFCYMDLEVGWFTALLVSVYVGIPTFVIVVCYSKVFQTVRRHNSSISQNKGTGALSVEELKVTRTLFITVVVFMGCWTPILIMDLIDTARGGWSLSRPAYAAYTFLAVLSCAVNPFIYGFNNPRFRKEYLRVFWRRTRERSETLPSEAKKHMSLVRRTSEIKLPNAASRHQDEACSRRPVAEQ